MIGEPRQASTLATLRKLVALGLAAAAMHAGTVILAAVPERGTYTAVSIVAPANEETVHDNTGSVPVQVSIEPPLQLRHGHRLRITLDGQPVATLQSNTHTLTNVDRGTHVLGVAVIDGEGRELITSTSVTFHMWRASALFPRGAK